MDEQSTSQTASETRALLHRNKNAEGIYFPAYVLIIIFASSSWISINGLWVEVPLFIYNLPEGWNFPSYLTVVVQLANIGPAVWSLLHRFIHLRDTIAIYFLLTLATISTILIGCFWHKTAYIAGADHSVPLLVLTGIVALVDCSSSVIFLPFTARFKSPAYVAGFCLGSWVGAIIPGIFGLAQGIEQNPTCVNSSRNASDAGHLMPVYPPLNFSIGLFCMLLCVMLVASASAFTALLISPKCRMHMIPVNVDSHHHTHVQNDTDGSHDQDFVSWRELPNDNEVSVPAIGSDRQSATSVLDRNSQTDDLMVGDGDVIMTAALSRYHCVAFMVLTFWLSALSFSLLPSLQSFSCLPYGNTTYALAVRLSSITGPVMCIIAMYWSTKSVHTLMALTAFGTILSGYVITLALMSPSPPLHDHTVGRVLVILAYVLLTAAFAYVRVIIAMIIRISAGARGLFWFGILSQAGGFCGAVLAFILVNVLNVFKSLPAC